jgi:hypothetical protein
MKESQIDKKIEKELRSLRKVGSFMRGTLWEGYIQCGKSGCKCKKRGEKGHGPYCYINITKGVGKVTSVMIPGDKIKEAKKLLKNYHLVREQIEKITSLNVERFTAIKSEREGREKGQRK